MRTDTHIKSDGLQAQAIRNVVEGAWARMSCDEVVDVMPLLASCDLRSPVRERVYFHLARCPACRKELVEYLRISNALKSHMAGWRGLPATAWSGLRETMEALRRREEMPHTSGGVQENEDRGLANRLCDALADLLLIGGVPPTLAGLCRGTLRLAIASEDVQ